MVHSLTLGKIIRLNTGFKSAPDHVFFSSQYCEGVKDFQCVPRDNNTVENFQEKTTKQKHSCNRNSAVIAENNNSCDALIPVLVATCGVFFFIAIVLFFICLKLWFHFRRYKARVDVIAGNQSQFELSYQNKNRIKLAESLQLARFHSFSFLKNNQLYFRIPSLSSSLSSLISLLRSCRHHHHHHHHHFDHVVIVIITSIMSSSSLQSCRHRHHHFDHVFIVIITSIMSSSSSSSVTYLLPLELDFRKPLSSRMYQTIKPQGLMRKAPF